MENGFRRNWMTRFWAIVEYELLWNIRKKKFIGVVAIAFALTTLSLILPVILYNIIGQQLQQNPDHVINTGAGIGGLGMFLFAVAIAMNSISGEFESGSIVPLLTKPVSRTMIFLAKLFAAFITLLSAYTVLFAYQTIGGIIIYGPQNNLHLLPLSLLGTTLSTFVWIAIVLAIGSISKSSLISALGTFGIFMALSISHPIILLFSDQAWILNYIPGNGVTGYILGAAGQTTFTPGLAISTGTDNIAANLVNYALYPSAEVKFYKMSLRGQYPQLLYSEPISIVLARSILVASAYIIALLAASWYAFKNAEVME
ncbi:MAG: ABC transporter permease [Nitrososphaerota archaeon]|nr:ABC transporter permease [Candidatus Bathyarchaeota archaeon]MDW8049394.1 ABC transporter permease [Nitrososphaerota archaeon]